LRTYQRKSAAIGIKEAGIKALAAQVLVHGLVELEHDVTASEWVQTHLFV
jgi:hypothetical protein